MQGSPSPLALLSGVGMIAVAASAVLAWQRGRRPLWRATGLGALAWTVSVALKVAWAVPLNKHVLAALERAFGHAVAQPASWLYIGLLTGVFECGITWLVVKRTRLRDADRDEAVAFGVGFGAFEALALGVASFLGMLAAIVFFDKLPPEARARVVEATSGSPALYALPIVERLATVPIHVLACVLVVRGVRAGQPRWFWLSFGFKTAVDALAAWGIMAFHVKESAVHLLVFEGLIVAIGAASVVALQRMAAAPNGRYAPAPWTPASSA